MQHTGASFTVSADDIIRRFVNEAAARTAPREHATSALDTHPLDGELLLSQLEASSSSLAAHVQLLQAQLQSESEARAQQEHEAQRQAAELVETRERLRQLESERWEALEALAVMEQRQRSADAAAAASAALARRAAASDRGASATFSGGASSSSQGLTPQELMQLCNQFRELGVVLDDMRTAFVRRAEAAASLSSPRDVMPHSDDSIAQDHAKCLADLHELAVSYLARHGVSATTSSKPASSVLHHPDDAELARHLQQQHLQLMRLVQHLAVGMEADAYRLIQQGVRVSEASARYSQLHSEVRAMLKDREQLLDEAERSAAAASELQELRTRYSALEAELAAARQDAAQAAAAASADVEQRLTQAAAEVESSHQRAAAAEQRQAESAGAAQASAAESAALKERLRACQKQIKRLGTEYERVFEAHGEQQRHAAALGQRVEELEQDVQAAREAARRVLDDEAQRVAALEALLHDASAEIADRDADASAREQDHVVALEAVRAEGRAQLQLVVAAYSRELAALNEQIARRPALAAASGSPSAAAVPRVAASKGSSRHDSDDVGWLTRVMPAALPNGYPGLAALDGPYQQQQHADHVDRTWRPPGPAPRDALLETYLDELNHQMAVLSGSLASRGVDGRPAQANGAGGGRGVQQQHHHPDPSSSSGERPQVPPPMGSAAPSQGGSPFSATRPAAEAASRLFVAAEGLQRHLLTASHQPSSSLAVATELTRLHGQYEALHARCVRQDERQQRLQQALWRCAGGHARQHEGYISEAEPCDDASHDTNAAQQRAPQPPAAVTAHHRHHQHHSPHHATAEPPHHRIQYDLGGQPQAAASAAAAANVYSDGSDVQQYHDDGHDVAWQLEAVGGGHQRAAPAVASEVGMEPFHEFGQRWSGVAMVGSVGPPSSRDFCEPVFFSQTDSDRQPVAAAGVGASTSAAAAAATERVDESAVAARDEGLADPIPYDCLTEAFEQIARQQGGLLPPRIQDGLSGTRPDEASDDAAGASSSSVLHDGGGSGGGAFGKLRGRPGSGLSVGLGGSSSDDDGPPLPRWHEDTEGSSCGSPPPPARVPQHRGHSGGGAAAAVGVEPGRHPDAAAVASAYMRRPRSALPSPDSACSSPRRSQPRHPPHGGGSPRDGDVSSGSNVIATVPYVPSIPELAHLSLQQRPATAAALNAAPSTRHPLPHFASLTHRWDGEPSGGTDGTEGDSDGGAVQAGGRHGDGSPFLVAMRRWDGEPSGETDEGDSDGAIAHFQQAGDEYADEEDEEDVGYGDGVENGYGEHGEGQDGGGVLFAASSAYGRSDEEQEESISPRMGDDDDYRAGWLVGGDDDRDGGAAAVTTAAGASSFQGAPVPRQIMQRAAQYAGDEGLARPSTAVPSGGRAAGGERAVPDDVLQYAQLYTGDEGDARPSTARPSVLRPTGPEGSRPVPVEVLQYVEQYTGEEGGARPSSARPSVMLTPATRQVPAPDMVLHMAAQYQTGREGDLRPTTAPSSDRPRGVRSPAGTNADTTANANTQYAEVPDPLSSTHGAFRGKQHLPHRGVGTFLPAEPHSSVPTSPDHDSGHYASCSWQDSGDESAAVAGGSCDALGDVDGSGSQPEGDEGGDGSGGDGEAAAACGKSTRFRPHNGVGSTDVALPGRGVPPGGTLSAVPPGLVMDLRMHAGDGELSPGSASSVHFQQRERDADRRRDLESVRGLKDDGDDAISPRGWAA